ncbi:MAG: glutaminyl-tRNA synthase (glutamine-hydrolyzing) subunit B [Candidatus Kerfeldbacteria bacterium RIFOXYA2_FULL_38_24]|uniref:Aspartyl/glutamyl-tRNA(Asn/Gln) amidotransferase subunit B n=1 Tax=Candidatus Kerfeldbacteria bacterium RIFOXYB2_FULL_38_14 TaxID=1798547 RepID=A0A1G2BC60_9BACT|nr:MAG: glutaminyl-tRNA synthase (glutamine-hydrolyzing) subunit B [Candidatus Kerfeldbacteria bacterium RIFOXYB2_FULL_38_14]OGY86491.1 MAG: glutaminyl-tRNA synthase (glutamine-hydrolyzing) subunit B [Candidatus Kerfeldbacteria bacterium RIFOXYA2_FULL_38_24]OGY90479.1 MAG: glutaminyl-tRNA synthase (glutamine-hydrolyzing) subunit B [Candidatus Kerfeldbacteria bacterium RIFOXYC2_FULL_38_9]
MKEKYEAIIGLEIHLRLNTISKMFCGTKNADSDEPNVYTCPICLGHPGTLPQLNQEAVKLGLKLALALNCEINYDTKFDRKQYFYPDLPKAYQISQYDQPLAVNGFLEICPDNLNLKTVRIERLHLEEDAARLKHNTKGESLVDFNRAGAPLLELVTKPDLKSALEAKVFVQEVQKIARYLNVSQADMEKGHLRCDANVSLRFVGDEALYPKTEIKNMNSFRSVEKAIQYEIERQLQLWEKNSAPQFTTTRGWDDKRNITVLQRSKEEEADYRYFPEPDLPPLHFDTQEINKIRETLPEMPGARRERFRQEFSLSYEDARILTDNPQLAEFFEDTISELRGWLNSLDYTEGTPEEIWAQYSKKMGRLTIAWITSEIFKLCKEENVDFSQIKIKPENFAELLTLIYEKKINSSAGQKILKIMFTKGGDPSQIMQEHDLAQVSDENTVAEAVDNIINSNPQVVKDYKNGKEKALMYLVGQVMKTTKGKINPETATKLLKDKLTV